MLVFILLFAIFNSINSQFCHKDCICLPTSIRCYGANNPRFEKNALIRSLWLVNGYMRNMSDLKKAFPNLKYLILRNMRYVNCYEMEELLDAITISQNYCQITSTRATMSKIL